MGDSSHIRDVIERVVSASLSTHVTALKNELVDNACKQLEAIRPATAVSSAGGASTDLNSTINSILDATTQVEILSSLLKGTSKFAERAALFVIRGGAATGWRATGLDDNEGIKALTLELNEGVAFRAYTDRVPAEASAAEFDAQFVSTYGAPADGTNVLVVPLLIRDKVAALVYADAGVEPGGRLDPAALEALTHCAGMWLEIMAARKGAASAAAESDTDRHLAQYAEPASETEPQAAPVEPTVEPVYEVVPPAPEPESAAAAAAAPAFESVPGMQASSPAAAPGLSPEDEEVHKKAKRFAKLLVDEIKLYNQAKVAEGRANKDLYSRLKDDIDKSRATYDKRYAATAAASGNYFTQELIRILANDDATVLGSGFSG